MLVKFIILLVKGYQYCVSPFTPCHCRFLPTCSQYAVEACQTHGALRGVWLACKRLLRCHPFAKYGFDPVPTKSTER